ncbi:hypothetical protein C7417_0099 [Cupriavidus plantarum]|nr:hypothetical protein C7417_0099 [Cupriavidus plantarum]
MRVRTMPNASSMPSGSETPTHAVGRCQPVRRASRDGSNVGGEGNGNADGNGNVWMSADAGNDRSLTSQMPASRVAKTRSTDGGGCPIARTRHRVVTNRCVGASLIRDARERDRTRVVAIGGRVRAHRARRVVMPRAQRSSTRAMAVRHRPTTRAAMVRHACARDLHVCRKRPIHAGFEQTHRNVARACRGCLAPFARRRARSSHAAPTTFATVEIARCREVKSREERNFDA